MLISALEILPAARKRSFKSCQPAWYGNYNPLSAYASCHTPSKREREESGGRDGKTYIPDIELITGVTSTSAEVVVRGRTRGRGSMQSLTCHGHTNLAWDRGSTKARLVFAVLFESQFGVEGD